MRAVGALILCLALPAAAAENASKNLIKNGSFELPVVTSAANLETFLLIPNTSSAQQLPGWELIYNGTFPGDVNQYEVGVSILTNDWIEQYPDGSNNFVMQTAEDGTQSLDLTGPGNPGPIGIAQTVKTVAGAHYVLSFYLGNTDNADPAYPLPSQVQVFVNGVLVQTDSNNANTPGNVNWQLNSVPFTATGAETTIAFVNATGVTDNGCGLDNVVLVRVRK